MNGFEQVAYKLRITLESGLHIGGGDTAIEIGGVDNKVIRDVISNEPYIPGSSLKGKMRHLLETYYANDADKLKMINQLFGVAGNEKNDKSYRQTRLQFVDLFMNQKTKKTLNKVLGPRVYTVVKYENKIDRQAGKGTVPRPTERVPKDSIFEGALIMNVIGDLDDDREAFEEVLNQGIELLNKSYIGGNGSRGYGKIKAEIREE